MFKKKPFVRTYENTYVSDIYCLVLTVILDRNAKSTSLVR